MNRSPFSDRLGDLKIIIVRDHPARWAPAPARPTKLQGRKGTKRGWKRLHPPRWVPALRLLPDGKVIIAGDTVYAYAHQAAAIHAATQDRP